MTWRRLLPRSDQSVAELHYAIQFAMGWSDSPLHQFHIHDKDFGVEHEGELGSATIPRRSIWPTSDSGFASPSFMPVVRIPELSFLPRPFPD
jgi:hypothetical protein